MVVDAATVVARDDASASASTVNRPAIVTVNQLAHAPPMAAATSGAARRVAISGGRPVRPGIGGRYRIRAVLAGLKYFNMPVHFYCSTKYEYCNTHCNTRVPTSY